MPHWNVGLNIHGAIKLDPQLNRSSSRALKSATQESETYTQIALREAPNSNHMRMGYFAIAFTVKAPTQNEALDSGLVYASQLCDLLSFVTRVGTEHEVDEESRISQARRTRHTATADRMLKKEEWNFIIGSLPHLHANEPRFMAACSWYRRGLSSDEVTEKLCCFWRVIERCALSYQDKSQLEDRRTKPIINAFCKDWFTKAPALLESEEKKNKTYELRNTISHGNEPLSPKLIEQCSVLIEELEEAAYQTLTVVSNHIASLSKIG